MVEQQNVARSLTTLALLKANFDAAQDHIGMFQPLLVDTIASLDSEDFDLDTILSAFSQRHGIRIPSHTMQVLLNRAKRRGVVRREGGRYFRSRIPDDRVNVEAGRRQAERNQGLLATRLREFAAKRGLQIQDDEEALLLVLAFIGENQLPMLLDRSDELALSSSTDLPVRQEHIVARFITTECLPDPSLSAVLQEMLEGFVLQNALLLKDISTAARRFQDLTVYFDSGFLLGALGLEGEPRAVAAREALSILRDTGARLAVFEKTLDEVRAILGVYERHLVTPGQQKRLHPSEVTRFFLSNRYTSSDVRQVIVLLETNIRQLGLRVRQFPERDPRFTLDEEELTKRLMKPDSSPLEPRVVHDVDCIAAILTLRRGARPTALDRGRAVFATTSGSVVTTVISWFREASEHGVPPIIHQLALSSIAWLKKPASATRLKLNELVALCASALKPSRQLWTNFLQHLEALETDGTLSSDEAVAIVANELTDRLLVEAEESEEDVDAATLTEVVERVRAQYQSEADLQVTRAEATAGREAEARRQLTIRVEGGLRTVSRWTSRVVAIVVSTSVVIGIVLLLPGVLGLLPGWALVAAWIVIAAFSLWSIYSFFYGTTLSALSSKVEAWAFRRLRERFVGETTPKES